MQLNEFPIIRKRYVQLLRVIQCIHLFLFLSSFTQALNASGLSSALSIPVFLDLGMVACMQVLILQVGAGRVSLAVNIHQLITLFFLVLMAVLNDGMRSSAIAAFPISLLIISIYTKHSNFLIYCVVLLTVVFGLGLSDVFGFLESGARTDTDRFTRLLVIYGFTSFLSWTLIRDLRFAYTEQSKERGRLVEARERIQQLADTDQLTGLLNRYGAYNHFDILRQKTDFSQSSIAL